MDNMSMYSVKVCVFEFHSLVCAHLGLGHGNAMKARTDNECVLHLVLIGLQFI